MRKQINKPIEVFCEQLAKQIMFGAPINLVEFDECLTDNNLQYRKGKTIDDVHDAVRKAFKNGQGKTEVELDFMILYLSKVFKMIEIYK